MKLLVLALAMLSLVSCATRVKGLQKSDSFTFANVQSGKIIAGGVVHSTEDWKNKTKINYSNRMKTQILDEREEFKVSNAGILVKKIGKKGYAKVISEFENDGALSEKSLSLLSSKIKGRRYVVFAKVEGDEVMKDRTNNEKTDSNGKKTGRTVIETKTTRKVDVNFTVIDLVDKNVAWSGMISKSKYKSLKYEKENGLVSLVKAIAGSDETTNDKYPYPKAPKLSMVLDMAFEGFAENLPEED